MAARQSELQQSPNFQYQANRFVRRSDIFTRDKELTKKRKDIQKNIERVEKKFDEYIKIEEKEGDGINRINEVEPSSKEELLVRSERILNKLVSDGKVDGDDDSYLNKIKYKYMYPEQLLVLPYAIPVDYRRYEKYAKREMKRKKKRQKRMMGMIKGSLYTVAAGSATLFIGFYAITPTNVTAFTSYLPERTRTGIVKMLTDQKFGFMVKFYSVIKSLEKGPKSFTRELLKSSSNFLVRGVITPLSSNTVLGVFGGSISGKIVDGLFTASLDSVFLVPGESTSEDLEAELLKQQMERELELAQIRDKYGPNATVSDIINHRNSTNYKIKEFFTKHKAVIFSALVSTAVAGVMMIWTLPLLISYFPFLGSALGLSGKAAAIGDIVLNNLVYPYLMPVIANWLQINVIVEYLTNKFINGLDWVVPDVVRRKIREKFGFDIVRNVVAMTIFRTVFNSIIMTTVETGVMTTFTFENAINLYQGLTIENISNLQQGVADTTSKLLSGDITLPEGINPVGTIEYILGYTNEADIPPQVDATDVTGPQKPDSFWKTVSLEKKQEMDDTFKNMNERIDQLRTQTDNHKSILNGYKEEVRKLNELSNTQDIPGFKDSTQRLNDLLNEYQSNIDKFDKNLKGYEDALGKLTMEAEGEFTPNTFDEFYKNIKGFGQQFTQNIPKIEQASTDLNSQEKEIAGILSGYNSELNGKISEKKIKIETLSEIDKISKGQINIKLNDVRNVDSENLKGAVKELKTFNDRFEKTARKLEDAMSKLELQMGQVNELIDDANKLQGVSRKDMSPIIGKLNGLKSSLNGLEDTIKSRQDFYGSVKGKSPEIQKAIILGDGGEYLQGLTNLLSQTTEGLDFKDAKELENVSDSLGADISSTITERFQQMNPEFDISSLPSNKAALQILDKMSSTSQTVADLEQKTDTMKIKANELADKIKTTSATLRLSKHLFNEDETTKKEFRTLRDDLTSDLRKVGTEILNPLNKATERMKELNARPVTNYEDLVKLEQELGTLVDEINSTVTEIEAITNSINANLDNIRNIIHDKHKAGKQKEKEKKKSPENIEDTISNEYMGLLGQLEGLSEKQIETMGIKNLTDKYNKYKNGDTMSKPTVNDLGPLDQFLEKWEKTYPDEKSANDARNCLMHPENPSCRSYAGVVYASGAIAGAAATITGAVATGGLLYYGYGAAMATAAQAGVVGTTAAAPGTALGAEAYRQGYFDSPETQANIEWAGDAVGDTVELLTDQPPSFIRALVSLEAFTNLLGTGAELTEENNELMGRINSALGENGGVRERASLAYELGSTIMPVQAMWGDGAGPELYGKFKGGTTYVGEYVPDRAKRAYDYIFG